MLGKGQVTVLIILGIVVVAAAFVVYSFKDKLFLSEWQREQLVSLEVPLEAQEVQGFVQSCVEDVARDGMNILGAQGGYIVIPDDPIGQGEHNKFSNSLTVFPDSDFRVPYWFYRAANGVQKHTVPTKEEMELELASYMDQNLAKCATNDTLYQQHNAVVGVVQTETKILDDKVLFTVSYPLHIEKDSFSFDFQKFYTSVGVPLGRMFSVAQAIQGAEDDQNYFELLTYDMLVLYDEIPFSGQRFDCSQQSWDVNDVEKSLKDIVETNVGAVKLQGTKYKIHNDLEKKYYEFDAGIDEPYNAHFSFSTLWPFSLQVSPTRDGKMVEDTYTGANPAGALLRNFFCLTSYNFVYDIQYPVLVSLYDPSSDYLLQFATMVILDNNQPRENTEGTLELGPVGDEICDDAVTPLTVNVEGVADDGSLFDLDNASVRFQCVNNLCPLGEARNGLLESTVPACINAQIVAEKEGYQTAMEVLDTLEEGSATVVLEKYSNLTYDLQIVDLDGNVRPPTSDDTIFLTLTEQDTGYSVTVTYPKMSETVLLIPGTYTVQGTVVSKTPFTISVPEKNLEKCRSNVLLSIGGIFGWELDTECLTDALEPQTFDQALNGGAAFTWYLSRSTLAGSSHVTFYVTVPGSVKTEEDLKDVSTFLDTGVGAKEPEVS